MEPVGAPREREMAPIVAPAGPCVAASRRAADRIPSSSNFETLGTRNRIYLLISVSSESPEDGQKQSLSVGLYAGATRDRRAGVSALIAFLRVRPPGRCAMPPTQTIGGR